MEKTEKTMAELQIEKNMAYEFDKITEAGSALQPLSGPGCVLHSLYIHQTVHIPRLVCLIRRPEVDLSVM